MKISFDKWMLQIAYAYITIPFLLFFVGWLRWYYALGLSAILLISCVIAIRATKNYVDLGIAKNKNKIILATVIIIILVFFSGLGGYSYQTEDHQVRNGIFRDLVTHTWPFKINESGHIPGLSGSFLYIYYIIYWLPAALAGKLLGWQGAQFFFFLWSCVGVMLTAYFLFRLLRRISIRALLVFLFCGSVYIIGLFYRFPFTDVVSRDSMTWAKGLLLAGSYLDSLYWIFNQTVVPTLIALIILNQTSKKNIIFLFALCYLHGPFFFIGFFPFIAIMIFQDIFRKEAAPFFFIERVRPYFTFQNTIAALCLVLVGYFYLSASYAVQPLYLANWKLKQYLAFAFLSFGLLSLILFRRYKSDPNFYMIILMLLILPWIKFGTIQPFTFCARVALAPVFMLSILTIKYLIEEGSSIYKKALVVYLSVASLSTIFMVGRSVVFTIGYYVSPGTMNRVLYEHSGEYTLRKMIFPAYPEDEDHNFLVQDDLKSVDSPTNPFNKFNKEQLEKESFFNKYLLKKPKSD